MRALRWRFFALTGLIGLIACAPNDPTQLVVVVDSDLSASAIDGVEVSVLGLEGGEQTARALLSEGALPRYVVLEQRGGALGPIDVEARALLSGTPTGIARKARTSFVRGQTLRLDLFLAAACASRTCDATETCDRGACVAPEVASDRLTAWTGLENDAGVIGDGGDTDALVSDAGIDAPDADAGTCTCPSSLPANTTSARCVDGRCIPVCAPGFSDCDGVFSSDNGCEQSLNSADHCGACGAKCLAPTARELGRSCVDATCVVECRPAFGDCNEDPVDGCELALTSDENCGACGNACDASPSDRCVIATRMCRRS